MLKIEGISISGKVRIIFGRDGDELERDRDESVNGEGSVQVVYQKPIRRIDVNLIGAGRSCTLWVCSKVVET